MKSEALNPRLSCAAGFVRQGAVFADIGTAHAYLPLFLLEAGRISRAVCSDINEGPLESARRNARERGLLGSCEFILADGAERALELGATDIAICGMGGELIADIVKRARALYTPGVRLILQPMTRQAYLRAFLLGEGFKIVTEGYSREGERYYLCVVAEYTGEKTEISEIAAEVGECTEIVNKSAHIGYLKTKKRALEKAINGRKLGGTLTEFDREILARIDGKISELEKGESYR